MAARGARTGRERGFSLAELVVGSAVLLVSLVLVLNVLDDLSLFGRRQRHVADLQQSVQFSARDVAQMVRAAGRGGLAGRLAVVLQQNVPPDTTVGATPVLDETDILTVRGSLDAPIFRVDSGDPDTLLFNADRSQATLLIDSRSPSGLEQPLDSLHALVNPLDGTVRPDPILLVSAQGDAVYAVVELATLTFAPSPFQVLGEDEVERATLTLTTTPLAGTHTASYLALSPGGVFPPTLNAVLFASVLEEYRFFVRREYSIPGLDTSPLSPKLARARMFPGTDVVRVVDGAAFADIADNILDLQATLGIDRNGDGRIEAEQDAVGNPIAKADDEWRYNDAGDDAAVTWDTSPLLLVGVSLLGRTDGPDFRHLSRPIAALENRVYGEGSPATEQQALERRYRRWLMQSVVTLRNV